MKRIALYGYGAFGHRMEECLVKYWSDVFQITRIYERNPKIRSQSSSPLPAEPEKMAQEYADDLFEAVMICIADGEVRDSIRGMLQEAGIPLVFPGQESDFAEAEEFVCRKEKTSSEYYELHKFTDMLGSIAVHRISESMFLYNEEGKILKEHWDMYAVDSQYELRLYYPLRFTALPRERIHFAGKVCVLAKLFSGNYWHFINECLDCVYLAEEAGFDGCYIVPDNSFCKELMHLLGIADERIIPLSCLQYGKVYAFKEVWVCHRREINYAFAAKVLRQVSEKITEGLEEDCSLPDTIYVRRIGSRRLLNGREIAGRYGFTEIIPEDFSVQDQIRLFYQAKIVLSEHGANSANSLFMRKGAVFVETFGNGWKFPFSLYSLHEKGVHYLPVSDLHPEKYDRYRKSQDYVIDEVLLETMIENALQIRKAEGASE